MSKSQATFGKKEKEKNRQKWRIEKEEKKQLRQANSDKGKNLEEMFAYVDENGNISSTPPNPSRKKAIISENIQVSVLRQEDKPVAEVIRTGTVTFFNESKGFGFIKDMQSQESVFVHVNALLTAVNENDKVTFEVEQGHKGPNAVKVKKI